MKGNNSLTLNEATMIEAMQEWLIKRMGEFAPKVTSVKPNPGDSDRYCTSFTVSTTDQEKLS